VVKGGVFLIFFCLYSLFLHQKKAGKNRCSFKKQTNQPFTQSTTFFKEQNQRNHTNQN